MPYRAGLGQRWFGALARLCASPESKLDRRRQVVLRHLAESLERRLLFISTTGIADWQSIGPSPSNGGQVSGLNGQFNPVSGAIAGLAPHPTNPDVLYAASVNGGIWRTRDARDTFPNWQPLTDRFPTLSMGDITFDRSDASSQTLYAGVGVFSSSGKGKGGTGSGILKTVDGGDTWRLLASAGPNSLAGERVEQLTANGNVVLAGGRNIGLFRSTDGGQTFANVSLVPGSGLPAGPCTGLVRDPGSTGRYYAAVVGGTGGVFVSNDSGLTWAPVNNGLSGLGAATRLRLAQHRNIASNTFALYVAIVGSNGQLSGLFRSADGTNWLAMDTPSTNEGSTPVGIFPGGDEEESNGGEDDQPADGRGSYRPNARGDEDEDGETYEVPGGQGGTHLSLEADPANPNVVFIGGDRQPQNPGPDGRLGTGDDTWPNSIGSVNFTGRLFRGDASRPAGSQFTPVTDNFASNTAPHADSRDLAFDAAGNLLEADDGGVYALSNPNSNSPLIPRFWVSRVGNLAVSELYSVAYDARLNQTLGGAQDTGASESTTGSVVPGSSQWQQIVQGDGDTVASDNQNPSISYHYFGALAGGNGLASFQWRRYVAGISGSTTHAITLLVNGAAGKTLRSTGFDTIPYPTPYVLNGINPAQMLIGTGNGASGYLYESFDRGDTLTNLSTTALTDLRQNGIDEDGDGLGAGGSFDPDEFGPSNNVGSVSAVAYGAAGNASLLYAGTTRGIFVRTSGNGPPTQSAAYTGAQPRDIALDPATGDAYVLDVNGSVWRTTNAGASWVNLTGTLATVPGDKRTIAVYRRGNAMRLLVGGQGGVFRGDLSGTWEKFGRNLPHAPVNDLLYDADSDQLIAGTIGRGAYVLRQASQLLTAQRFVTITADDVDETFTVSPNVALPGFISITRSTAVETLNILDLELSTIDGLIIDGRGGNDTLNLGQTGSLNFPITFIGGTGDDTLNLGTGILGVLPAPINFDGTAGLNDRVNLNDQATASGIRYDITSDFVARSGFGGLRYTNLDRLVLNCGSGDDTVNVTVGAVLPVELHGNGGFDTIGFNDVENSTGRTWIINPQQVIIDGALTATNEFEAVAIRAGTGPDKVNISGGHTQAFDFDAGGGPDVFTIGFLSQARFSSSGGPVLLKGGAGDDRFIWQNGSNNYFELIFGPFTEPVTIDGGAGSNSLLVDDTVRANTSYQLYVDRFYAIEPAVFPAGADFKYGNIATVDIECSDASNAVAVYGTSAQVAPISIMLGGGADTVTIFPHDAAGNLTLAGALGIYGGPGADILTVDDTASPRPIAYGVDTPFGPLATRVLGLGSGTLSVSPDVESIVLNAGSGPDLFKVQGLQTGSALRMNGGGGDDSLEITPSFHKLEGNLNNAAFFGFDGGPGSDTVTLFNQATSLGWTYTRPLGSLLAQSPAYGAFRFTLSTEEQVAVRSGPQADTYRLQASAPGVKNLFFGGGGNDMMILGTAGGAGVVGAEGPVGAAVAAGLVLSAIHGESFFDGEEGSDNVSLDDSGSPTGKNVHISQTGVGAASQDTLFGAGGSFRFANAETLELHLGSGGDAVVAQGNAAAAVAIDAGPPGPLPDSVEVDLTGEINPVFTPDVNFPGATFTADNRQPLRVAFFESVNSFFSPTSVVGRHLFYNNSKFDGSDETANAGDDGAVAPDKVALLPGQTATFANVSSYAKGINGIMFDVVGLPADAESALSLADFVFRVGSSGDPNAWVDAPSALGISVRRGAGDDGSDRVTILFPDNAICNKWLQVTLRGGGATGLSLDDVFYFGSLVGETGDNPAVAAVGAPDLVRLRNILGTGLATITSPFDFNRDGRVDAADLVLVRNSIGHSLGPLATPAQRRAASSSVAMQRSHPGLAMPAGGFSSPFSQRRVRASDDVLEQ